MSKIGERIRKERESRGWDQAELAQRLGIGQPAVSSIESGRTVKPRQWREIADLLDVSHDEFRQLMIDSATTKESQTANNIAAKINQLSPMNRDVPVYGHANGGDDGMYLFNGDVIGWVSRPPQLDGVADAYATYVDGESMYPRYKPGETVWLNPHKPAARGDDIVVQLRPNDEYDAPRGFIKEYVRKTPTKLVVMQHNPAGELEYELSDVVSIHPIVFAQRG